MSGEDTSDELSVGHCSKKNRIHLQRVLNQPTLLVDWNTENSVLTLAMFEK
jgi:hypothetical protein